MNRKNGEILVVILSIVLISSNTILFAKTSEINLDNYKDHPRLQSLIKILKDGDKDDKPYTCIDLSLLGNKRAIQPILSYLVQQAPNADNYYTLKALAGLHNKAASDAFINFVRSNRKKLNSSGVNDILAAMEGLNKKDQKIIIDLLMQDKLDEKNVDYMLRALEEVSDEKYKTYLLKLLNNNKFNKCDAADALSEYFNKQELWKMMNDIQNKRALRMAALFALAQKGDQRVKMVIIERCINKLKNLLRNKEEFADEEKNIFPLDYGYDLLGYYKGDKEVRDYLINDLHSDVYFVILALGEVGGKDAIDALKKHFPKSASKKYVLRALADLGEDKFVADGYNIWASELVEIIRNNPDTESASDAVRTLYKLCKKGITMPNMTNYILNDIKDGFYDIKDKVMLCMIYSKVRLSRKLMTKLWHEFRQAWSIHSKLAIASLLLHHSNSIETAQILKIFDGKDLSEAPENELYEFARALTLHKGKLVDKILIHLLRDNETSSVRAQAAKSLSGRKSKAVRKALEYAEKYEAYPNVRKAVKKALKSINNGQNQKSGSVAEVK